MRNLEGVMDRVANVLTLQTVHTFPRKYKNKQAPNQQLFARVLVKFQAFYQTKIVQRFCVILRNTVSNILTSNSWR